MAQGPELAGLCSLCLSVCGTQGLSPLRVCVGTRGWPAGFEEGSLCDGKPFLSYLFTHS